MMGGNRIPEWVIDTAHRHIAERPPLVGFTWSFEFRQRVASGWYFDYVLERLPHNPPCPGSGVGGAQGFVVQADGSVQVVSVRNAREIFEAKFDGK